MIKATNLEELRRMLANGIGEMPCDLPTFGGEEPWDTSEVWSWDDDSLLVGTFRGDLQIIPRRDMMQLMTEPTTTIGERRLALRVNAGLSVEQLAATARISLGTVTKAEAGGMLQERVIRDIAAALGCTAREYIG